MSDSLLCSLRGGARALTPTPPSVTSASRVRLFPRYVRPRITVNFFNPALHTLSSDNSEVFPLNCSENYKWTYGHVPPSPPTHAWSIVH
ncbi:unnamed protein product%2C partial [Scomber scombrus]|uniref:Unnamed protein product, partial n=1 Tax=Scomber scombrus TaxID=13677 RepID=A0AAV1PD97_SCOSC